MSRNSEAGSLDDGRSKQTPPKTGKQLNDINGMNV